jgi:hypothetical protein
LFATIFLRLLKALFLVEEKRHQGCRSKPLTRRRVP